jgi:peptide/nickel transport system permease protein
MGLVVGVGFGIPLGLFFAIYRSSWIETVFNGILVLLGTLPVYVTGVVLILIFGLQLGWVPMGGFVEFQDNPWEHIRILILPSLVLGIWVGALTARMTRNSLIDVLSQDYIRTAYSKGLQDRKVYFRHAIKNALIPVVTTVGLQVGELLGGAIFTETVFTWPGLGSAFVSAVNRRDYPIIQGVVIIASTAFIFTNLIVDVVIRTLDPRISYN